MIEILGKVLTPLLFFGLIFLIVKGIVTSIGEVALNSSANNLFFDGLVLGYQTLDVLAALTLIIIVTLFSIFVTNIGLEQIISFAGPILTIIYSAAIILVFLTFFDKYIKSKNIYKFSVFSAMSFALLEVISTSTQLNINFLKLLPFSNEGLGWLTPALIFSITGAFTTQKSSK